MIGYYNYTVILTYVGMISGFVGMTYVWRGDLQAALICLMLSGFCDMFDGKIASTMKRTKQEKSFGIQIDSLSDLLCFGVLPAFIVLYHAGGTLLHTAIASLYVLCALIRLAWFNVDEEDRQSKESGGRETYLGLPVTTAALLFPFLIGLGRCFELPMHRFSPWVLLGVAVAFLSPVHLKKPGKTGKIVMVVLGVAALAIVLIGGSL